MNRLILLTVGISLIAISCKKDYTCSCVEKFNGVETNNNSKTVGFKSSKDWEASWWCDNLESTHTVDTTVVSYDCKLSSN